MHTTRRRLPAAILLLVLALFAGACSPSALEFTIGDCVNVPDGGEITEFESVDCETVHDAEVFALPQFPADEEAPYPDQAELEEFASTRCIEEFPDYVGTAYESSVLFATQLIPGREAWEEAGDREVVCLLVGPPLEGEAAGGGLSAFEQLTGSKRDSGE